MHFLHSLFLRCHFFDSHENCCLLSRARLDIVDRGDKRESVEWKNIKVKKHFIPLGGSALSGNYSSSNVTNDKISKS